MESSAATDLTLSLADGTRWLIRAGDARAARIVATMGAAMRLQPGSAGRELLVVVHEMSSSIGTDLDGPGPALCVLAPPRNDDMLVIGMSRLSLAIAHEAQSREGILIHGALAEYPSHHAGADLRWGILLAGPGTVGKTTASSRLPKPWCSLSDDAALVVRDEQGRYWAHPWPTWSRFYSYTGEPPWGGSWDVQHAVPLRAIFFLNQAPTDRVEAIMPAHALALMIGAVAQVSLPMSFGMDEEGERAIHQEWLAAAEALAKDIPTYALHISIDGAFWEEIECVLERLPVGVTPSPAVPVDHMSCLRRGASRIPDVDSSGAILVTYTGPSMNPTFRQPDLLAVMAYGDRPMRAGDVIYYHSPEDAKEVVHRVVSVTTDGLRTRGDNNPLDDLYLLPPTHVIGRVMAARRSLRWRRVVGGWQGRLVGQARMLRRRVLRLGSKLLHGAYRGMAKSGVLRRLVPARFRSRVVVFRARQRQVFKLMMGTNEVGRWRESPRCDWDIRLPFRPLVNVDALPSIPADDARPRRSPRPTRGPGDPAQAVSRSTPGDH